MEENFVIEPINQIIMEKKEENNGDDNLMTLQGTGKELLNKILDKVEYRYNNKDIKQKNIYSLLGLNILIAVNPYGDMDEIKKIYYTKEIEDFFRNIENLEITNNLKAHIYYLIESSYRKMLKTGKSQNFIITGESGSGKTESSKLILLYLTSSNNDKISSYIMDSNPLLEAFGNAKTVRNDNSSRFGKFIKINFSKEGKILDASIESYLLEKSRVTQVQKGEENFKIFYLLVLGKNEEDERKYKIKPIEYYNYLRNEKYIENIRNNKYKEDFNKIKECLNNFEFSVEEIENIFKILSGILYLGNIEFIEKDNKKGLDIDDKNKEDLQNISEFFGVEIDKLKKILLFKFKKTGKVFIPYDMEKAKNIRDSIAKELYSELFVYIIKKINKKMKKEENENNNNGYNISILDIFGFENFEENSLEQLCINYANERLQQYFNQVVFKSELDIYNKEGINCDKIKYTDNLKIVNFIDDPKISIFNTLKEKMIIYLRFGKNQDKSFREDVYGKFFLKDIKNENKLKQIEKNDILQYAKNEKNSLYINHYAGTVKYNVKDIVKKNVLETNYDINGAFKESSNALINELFKDKPSDGHEKITGSGLTEKFKKQLDNLVEIFNQADNRYIKCIKPNNEKKENNFEREVVLEQMIYGGIEAAFQIKKQGYPVHKKKVEFIKEYELIFRRINLASFDVKIKDEIATIGHNRFNDFYQNGKTIFFMKEELENFLNEELVKIKQIREKTRKMFIKCLVKYWKPIIKVFLAAKKTVDIIKKLNLKKLSKSLTNYRDKIKKEKELEEIRKREIEEQIKKEKELEEKRNREKEEEVNKEKELEKMKIKGLNEENKKTGIRNNNELLKNNEDINQNVNINIVTSSDKSSNIIELDKLRKLEEEQNRLKKKNEELEKNYMDLLKKYSCLEERILNMEKHEKWNQSNNFIIAEINIKENDLNKKIKIISSFDEYKREIKIKSNKNNIIYYDTENDELKEKCLIKIDNKEIPFDYYYKFKKIGKHTIQYIFNEKIITSKYMFYGCKNLTNIDLSNFDNEDITDMSYMFNGCENLTNIDLSNLNTKKVINMCNMFSKCNSLKSIDISKFDTQNVTDMSYMFKSCQSLKTLNLSNFDTQNVRNMCFMFNKCFTLQSLDLSNVNTKNVTNMAGMFYKCYSLKNINLLNFNTQKVTNMCYMFNSCCSLQNINLSNFNTENVTNMCYMFCSCKSLQKIDTSSFNVQNVKDMRSMFSGCKCLSDIILFDLDNQKTIDKDDMFYERFSITNEKQLYSSKAINQKQTDINNIFYRLKLDEIQDEELEHINIQNPRLTYNKASSGSNEKLIQNYEIKENNETEIKL